MTVAADDRLRWRTLLVQGISNDDNSLLKHGKLSGTAKPYEMSPGSLAIEEDCHISGSIMASPRATGVRKGCIAKLEPVCLYKVVNIKTGQDHLANRNSCHQNTDVTLFSPLAFVIYFNYTDLKAQPLLLPSSLATKSVTAWTRILYLLMLL